MKLRYKILNGAIALTLVTVSTLAVTLAYTKNCELPVIREINNPMKAIIYRCYGGPEVLEQAVIEIPEPLEHQILVRVKAAAVNPVDWHYMRGSPYIMRLMTGIGAPNDQSMGTDFAGIVEKVGSDVTKFKIGDAVFGGGSGPFAEYVLANASKSVAHKPTHVSFEQSAAMPIAALTALQALRDKGQLKAGQKVLINGASGGVGTYAVQIAKSFGAEVHGVSSGRNIEMVTLLGADHMFNYKTESYIESEERYDLIVDMISNHSIFDNLKVLKKQGRMVVVGGGKGNWIGPLMPSIKAVIMNNFVDQELQQFVAQFTSKDLESLAELMRQGQLSSVIDRRYSLDEIQDAISYSESGRAKGKIIVTISK